MGGSWLRRRSVAERSSSRLSRSSTRSTLAGAPSGTLVIVGGEGGKGKFLGGFGRGTLRAPIQSAFTSQTLKGFVAKENAADLVVLKDLIEAGKVKPLIDRSFSLADVPQAMRYLRDGSGRKGKIVITV